VIRWETLIVEQGTNGKVSLHRLRKFSAIAMGWLGVAILLVGAVLTSVSIDKLALVAAVLVAPMTGGTIADAIWARRNQ